ncbi:MAG: PilZ domain-containing protein, partial [Candidatus Muiribacteriota bacterium]
PVEKKGYILDISGGGVFLRTPEKMEKDQMLKTRFMLGQQSFEVNGKIMRAIANKRGKACMYKYGINFEDIVDMERRKIIGYVFEVERKNIRKQKDGLS